MPDTTFDLLKQVALNAVQASYPVTLVFGTVLSVSPIRINLDQKLTITADQCILLKDMTLAAKNRVALLRQQGGQLFLVLGVLA